MNNWSNIDWNFIRIWIPNAGADVNAGVMIAEKVLSLLHIVSYARNPGPIFLACNIFDYQNAKQTKRKKKKKKKEKW